MPIAQQDRSFAITSWIFFSLGAAVTVLWLAVTLPTLLFVARAKTAQAVYVDSVARTSAKYGGSYLHPRFRFRTPSGQDVTVVASSGSTEESYSEGQSVRVFYDPANPQRARTALFLDLWIGPVILTGLLAMFLGMGATFRFAARSSTNRRYLRSTEL